MKPLLSLVTLLPAMTWWGPRDVSLLKSKGRTFYFKLFFGGPENIRSKQASAEAGPASPKAVRRGRPVAAALDCRAQDGASSPPAVAVVVLVG